MSLRRSEHRVTEFFEHPGGGVTNVGLVLDNQDHLCPAGAAWGIYRVRCDFSCDIRQRQSRQIHLHRRALAWLTVGLDVTARLLDEAVNLRQAQSGTLADLLSREKGVKCLSQDLLGHSGAVVGDREEYILTGNNFLMVARIRIIEKGVC